MVRAAMGDKKAKLGITWMYDMPNNIMPRGTLHCEALHSTFNIHIQILMRRKTRETDPV